MCFLLQRGSVTLAHLSLLPPTWLAHATILIFLALKIGITLPIYHPLISLFQIRRSLGGLIVCRSTLSGSWRGHCGQFGLLFASHFFFTNVGEKVGVELVFSLDELLPLLGEILNAVDDLLEGCVYACQVTLIEHLRWFENWFLRLH